MISYSIAERGALNVIRELESIQARSSNMHPAWTKVHEYLMQTTKMQFEGGGRRGPNKWAALDPKTIARKRQSGFRTKKMYRTEQLVSSLVNPGNPSHVYRTDDDSMVFGSSLEQHAAQQRGYASAPFRPPLDPTRRDVQNMTKMVADTIMAMKAGRSVVL